MLTHLVTFQSLKLFWGIAAFVTYSWWYLVEFLSNFVTFVVFCYGKSHKVYGNSWFSPRIFVLTGSKNLQCSMCNLLCVVELLVHNRRKGAIFSTRSVKKFWLLVQHVLFLWSSWWLSYHKNWRLWHILMNNCPALLLIFNMSKEENGAPLSLVYDSRKKMNWIYEVYA